MSDDGAGTLTLFALNRHLGEELSVDVTARGFAGLSVEQAHELRDDDLKAVNTKDDPDRVRPTRLEGAEAHGDRVRLALRPASWNVVRLRGAA